MLRLDEITAGGFGGRSLLSGTSNDVSPSRLLPPMFFLRLTTGTGLMPTDRYDRLIRLVERLGIATVICGVLLFAGWQAASWAGAKIVEPVLAEQLGIMAAARTGIERSNETAATNAASLSKLAGCQEQQAKTLSSICRVIERIEPALCLPPAKLPIAIPKQIHPREGPEIP